MSLGRAFEHNFGPEDGNLKELISRILIPGGGGGGQGLKFRIDRRISMKFVSVPTLAKSY